MTIHKKSWQEKLEIFARIDAQKESFDKLKELANNSNFSYVSCKTEDLKNLIRYAESKGL